MNDHIPSDLIPLHDDMIISFVNYELRVSLHQKTSDELGAQTAQMQEFFANKYAGASPVAAVAEPTAPPVEEPAQVEEAKAEPEAAED